jgi:transposase-like protein
MKKVFTPEQKADVAIAAIKGVQTTSQISSTFEVHPTQVGLWKQQALRGLSEVFSDKRRKVQDDHEALIAELYKTIGQRDMELAWLKKNLKRFEPSG